MENVPRFNLASILKTRDQLFDQVFVPRLHETPTGDALEDLVNAVLTHLPTARPDAVRETIRQLAGVALLPQFCRELAWRLAGNIPKLARGRAVGPWQSQTENEWVALQVYSVVPAVRDRPRTPGYYLSLRTLAGSSAGVLTRQFWSIAKVKVTAQRIGFSAPWGAYPYQDGAQYVNLRFLAYVDAAKSRDSLWLEELVCPSYCLTHNRRLLKLRYKVTPCRFGYGDRACHLCSVGYEECPAGTHRRTYVLRTCGKCGGDRLFDPDSPSPVCVECTHRQQRILT